MGLPLVHDVQTVISLLQRQSPSGGSPIDPMSSLIILETPITSNILYIDPLSGLLYYILPNSLSIVKLKLKNPKFNLRVILKKKWFCMLVMTVVKGN